MVLFKLEMLELLLFSNLKCIIQPNGGENCTGSSEMDWDVYTEIFCCSKVVSSKVQKTKQHKNIFKTEQISIGC